MAAPAFPIDLLDWADSTGRRVRTTESRLTATYCRFGHQFGTGRAN
jgi:hypothetical protein